MDVAIEIRKYTWSIYIFIVQRNYKKELVDDDSLPGFYEKTLIKFVPGFNYEEGNQTPPQNLFIEVI